jgi:hypothetical protein
LLFVSALVLLGGLCGLSNEKRTRTLGGLLGVGGVIFYLVLRLVFPPWRGWSRRDFYFGSGEYVGGMISNPLYIRAVWFLSVGFYLAVIGSLLLLVLSIRPLAESPKAFVFSSIGAIKELFFSTIAWIKRRLPAVFLLLSLLLPWWAKIELARSAPFRLGNILFTKSYVTASSRSLLALDFLRFLPCFLSLL